MNYHFDEVIDRSTNYSMKYSERRKHYGADDVIPLWVADMDFRTAPCVIRALEERTAQGIFGYTFRAPEIYEEVRRWQLDRHGYAFEPEKMSYSPGIVPGIRLMLTLFTAPGDAVIIQQPVYYPFADVVQNTGRKLVVSPLREENGRYTMDLADFEAKLRENDVKCFLLCNPHNPVGRVWTRAELKAVGDLCVKYGVQIISDEIHADLVFDGNRHTVMASVSPAIASITTTCTSPSKSFNLAGLQTSTLIFNTLEKKTCYFEEMRKMDLARSNCYGLVAALAAYRGGADWLAALLDYLSGNLHFIADYCDAHIPGVTANRPEATYLTWLDMRALGMDDAALARFCAEKAGLGLSGGASFGVGGAGFMRLNAGCPRSVLERAMHQLEAAVRAL